MAVSLKKKTAKKARLNLRASSAETRLIRLGAARRGERVSEFILKTACAEAEVALADQNFFELPPQKYAAFVAALDRPAKVIPALKKLFTEPSILEG